MRLSVHDIEQVEGVLLNGLRPAVLFQPGESRYIFGWFTMVAETITISRTHCGTLR